MHVASLELCKELHKVSGWERTEDHRFIETVWERSYHISEMGMEHPDYKHTPPEQRREIVVGDWRVAQNWRNMYTTGQEVFQRWHSSVQKLHEESFPAYDLGYLMRKLPPVIQDPYDKVFKHIQLWINGDGSVHIGYIEPYADDDKVAYACESSVIEDAVAELAIELFKQDIPTKEGEKKV